MEQSLYLSNPSISISMSIYLSICLSIYLCIYPSIHLSISIDIDIDICIFRSRSRYTSRYIDIQRKRDICILYLSNYLIHISITEHVPFADTSSVASSPFQIAWSTCAGSTSAATGCCCSHPQATPSSSARRACLSMVRLICG